MTIKKVEPPSIRLQKIVKTALLKYLLDISFHCHVLGADDVLLAVFRSCRVLS